MISIFEAAALLTAVFWALGTMLSAKAAFHMGSFAFNRLRLAIASLMLGIIVFIFGFWRGYDMSLVPLVLLSGFIGIFLGDAVLFAAIRRLGARRGSVIFAMNAPITAVLGYLFLNENLSIYEILGILIAITGVVLAILYGKRKSQKSHVDNIIPPLYYGVILGLLGALGQSIGSILIRPVMESGANPLMTSFLRVSIAAIAFICISAALPKATKPENPITKTIFVYVSLTALVGMVIGMSLILFAFSGANAGIVATLSATTPVLVLPMLWLTTRQAPALGAWIGAILVVIGSSLIFMA